MCTKCVKRTILFLVGCLIAPTAYSRWDADLRKDGMTDERIGFAAERGSSGSVVAIQCQEGAGIIVVFTLLVAEVLRGRVTYRVDGEAASTLPSFTIDSGVGVLEPEAKELIPKMLLGSELRAQGHQTGFSALPTSVFTFELSGSTEAFAEACSWYPEYDELIS